MPEVVGAAYDRFLVPNPELLGQLESAVEAVFSSWDTPRAQIYRVLNDIPHDLSAAVIVQEICVREPR